MRDYGKLENIQAKLNLFRQESKDPNFTQYLEKMQEVLNKQYVSAGCLEQDIDNKYKLYRQNMEQRDIGTAVQVPPQAETLQPLPSQRVSPQTPPVAPPQWAYPQPQAKKNSMEFKIGADIFCVIGVLFILVAFVMLGMTYMGELFKGISLYVIAAVLVLFSELLLRRRMDKLSQGVTGLGIAGLFAATLINYGVWGNFNKIVTVIIVLAVAVLAMIISRKRDSAILKLISFLGCYVAFWPTSSLMSDTDVLMVTAILFVINLVSILIPVKKHALGVHIAHAVTGTIFTIATAIRIENYVDQRVCILFVLSNILIVGFVFCAMLKCAKQKRDQGLLCSDGDYIGVYSVLLFFLTFTYGLLTARVTSSVLTLGDLGLNENVWGYICLAAYLIPAGILFCVLRKHSAKWFQYYSLLATIFIFVLNKSEIQRVAGFLAIFVISKLLSRVKALRVSEVVITCMTAFFFLLYMGTEGWYSFAFMLAFVLSVLALNHYKLFYQLMITAVVLVFTFVKLAEVPLLLSVLLGVLFVFLLVFNHVGIWRDKQQQIYNYLSLSCMAFVCLLSIFVQDYLNSLTMTILGTAVIILLMRKQYLMEFKAKYLVLSFFWTYMALVSGIDMAVVISSILMGIAIISVIVGFVLKQKMVRIYGLVLSVLVSLKIMFFDFRFTPIMERMLLFFVVGVIILAISCIYIVLEKKMSNRGETL